MYYQVEQKLNEIQYDEKNHANDKAIVFGCKWKLVDLYLRIKFEKERLGKQKETADTKRQKELDEQIVKWDQFIEEKKLREKSEEALEYIKKTSPMYKKLYETGARLGIDYIVIPNGAAYHYPATSMDHRPERCFLDYEQLGYEKGKPCENYNSGACVVFDGEDLILTCDHSLYTAITGDCDYKTQGYIPFYNGGQEMYFDSTSLERQFENMIKQTKGNNYQRVPLGCGNQRSYKDELYWKSIRQKGHNEKGFDGPRKKRHLPEEFDALKLFSLRDNLHNR